MCDTLSAEEKLEHDRFLEECIADPSIRDKMSILTRTYQNKRRVKPPESKTFRGS